MTLNSPQSLLQLYGLATSTEHNQGKDNKVWTAELMREVGLKCIGLNGVRGDRKLELNECLPSLEGTTNDQLTGSIFRRSATGCPKCIEEATTTKVSFSLAAATRHMMLMVDRHLNQQTIGDTIKRAHGLWDSVYRPFTDKLTAKLAQSHPDLPVFIIEGEYGALFSDPAYPGGNDPNIPNIGRVLMSVLAVSVLRAQTGVGPQVVSHIFGLRKAFEDGSADSEAEVQGGKWLASNEGSQWLLEQVDSIVDAVSEAHGTTFAPGYKAPKAKL
jgi:hypothetical protein